MARAFEDTALKTPEQTAPLVGDPAPLGLAGFGITTLLLSLINAKILPAAHSTVLVLSLALAFGGLAQFAGGMWAFKRGNTFAATAFTAYGAFWLSFYLLVVVFLPLVPKAAAPSDIENFVGWYLLALGHLHRLHVHRFPCRRRAVQAVFFLLTITFVVLAIGKFATSDGITQVGGLRRPRHRRGRDLRVLRRRDQRQLQEARAAHLTRITDHGPAARRARGGDQPDGSDGFGFHHRCPSQGGTHVPAERGVHRAGERP